MSRFLTEIPDGLFEGESPSDPIRSGSFGRDYEMDDPFIRVPESKAVRQRPKAIYKKPSTDESKKPFIANLSKGMPAASVKPDYQAGDRVFHVKYGEGTVKSVEPGPRDYKVKVEFDDHGQKIMYAAFAKLVKC